MEMRRLGLVCVALLVSLLLFADCNAQEEGKKEKKDKGKAQADNQQKGGKKEEKKQSGPTQREKGQTARGGKGPQGKFTTNDKSECTWKVSETDTTASLRVECLQGGGSFWCVFAGNPSSCPQYAAQQKNYWKQIARALKRQKNACQDPKAVLKSKECKKGPKEAHLSLLSSSLVEAAPGKEKKTHHGKKPPQPSNATYEGRPDAGAGSKECVEDVEGVDQKQVAEEYCGESWGSLCAFFFSMLQNKKC